MKALSYRADIDGLRAFAVLSVIIFHINPAWLPNGFLGVDIFFVLSGFLITSIIHKEMEEGEFSFKNFYIRRIKRILPLFFVVLIVGILVCWWIFMPNDIIGVLDSAKAAIFFLANRYFAKQGDYFAISSDEKPFLHLWSLSTEEQFYFIFPVILLFMFRISFIKNKKLIFLGVGSIILLLSSLIDLRKFGVFWEQYYLPHLRAGEMLVGSFLAVYMNEKKLKNNYFIWISGFSLLVLIVSLFLKNIFTPPLFPGILALIPCMATALLIFANQERHFINRLFSYPLIVWLGKISYSLYLWHWVVLAIMRYLHQNNKLPIVWVLVVVIIMFFLSVLTYYFIETPVRKRNFSFYKSLIYFYILPSILVFVIIKGVEKYPLFTISEELQYPSNICHNKIEGNCIKGDLSKKPKVLVIGNSYVGQMNDWIDVVGKKEGWSAAVVSSDGYAFAFDFPIDENDKRRTKYYKEKEAFFMKYYKDYPIIVFHYHNTPNPEGFEMKFLETCKRLIREGKQVYVVAGVVDANIDVLRDYNFISKNLPSKKIKGYNNGDILDFIPNDLGIKKVDLRKYIPDSFYIDGKPIYKDKSHWNVYGARKMAEKFIRENRFVEEDFLN